MSSEPIDLDKARAKRKKRPRQAADGDDLPAVSELNLEGFRCTDLGNAERLVERYRGQFRYCYARKKWLLWRGTRWVWDEHGVIVRMAKQVVRAIYGEAEHCPDEGIRQAIAGHARRSEKAGAIAAMVTLAQSEHGVAVAMDDLDSDPDLLNCENGTVDLRTGELRGHEPKDLITKLCPARYAPGAEHPVFEKFLRDSTGEDASLRTYIQRAAGYSVQGRASERALFFVYGPPGSAKSTLIDALAAMLGDYHVGTSPDTWLVQKNEGGNRGDLVRLAGCRLVTTVEFKRGARFDEALIKKVTGGDEITAAAKYEADVTFRPAFALWFAANDAPTIREDDAGMWDRMKRIPFSHVIPLEQRDKRIKELLRDDPECRAAVLSWAVAGCLAWRKDGLGSSEAVEASNREYQAEMDPTADFFSERCIFERGASIEQGELRKLYDKWAKEEGARFTLGRKEFQKAVEQKGGEYVKARGKRWVKGIRQRGEWEEDPEPGINNQIGLSCQNG